MINSNQLIRKLETLGVPVPIATLRLWASEDIIPNYEEHGPANKPRLKKLVGARPKEGSDAAKKRQEKMQKLEEDGEKVRPGRPCSLWLPETVEQAAAVWAVRYSGLIKPRALTTEMIKVIKRAAAMLDERPFAIYTLPSVTGPLSTQHIDLESIEMTFVSENCDGLDLFPGKKYTEKAACLNELVVSWVAAREKVRAWAAKGMSATYIVEHYPNFASLTPGEVDFSQIDPWRANVPCPWRIDRPARVALHWWSRPSKNKALEFGRMAFPVQRTLTKSDRNKIVLYENGVDTREFFKIDVGDREGWAKAELEKTDREIEVRERTLLRLRMEKTPFIILLAMEEAQGPFETLTAREKLGLKTAQELNGLILYRSGLKNRFGI